MADNNPTPQPPVVSPHFLFSSGDEDDIFKPHQQDEFASEGEMQF